MTIRAVVQTLDGLDETIKALYKKDGDVFRLDVEGLVDKSKLDEFRDSNVTLKAQVEKLIKEQEKFKDIDPAKYAELLTKLQGDEEKKLLKDGNIEAVVALRTDQMKKGYEEQIRAKDALIAKAEESAGKARKERDNYIVEAELRKEAGNPEMGYQSNLADILKHQVLAEFSFREGKVMRIKGDGTPHFGKSGDPETVGEFLQGIVKDRPYLVKSSSGGGAQNNGQGVDPSRKQMKRSEFNSKSPDERMKLSKEHVVLTD